MRADLSRYTLAEAEAHARALFGVHATCSVHNMTGECCVRPNGASGPEFYSVHWRRAFSDATAWLSRDLADRYADDRNDRVRRGQA